MPRACLVALAAALAAAAARPQPDAPARYAIEVADGRRVAGVLTYRVECPDLKAKEWTVFAAAAPELPGQTRVKTTLAPAGAPAADQSPLARPILVARVPATAAGQKGALAVRVTYEATLRARTLVELPPGAPAPTVAPLPAADRKHFLAETGDIDFKHEAVRKWLRDEGLVRATGADAVGFARAVFRKVRDRTAYHYAPDLDRKASAVCAAGRSDCGGLSVLVVAALRANGVPARVLYGRWAASADPAATLNGAAYYQWHVKAEFYADGVGWVPVDPAGAVLHDRTPDGLRYFGADPGDFVTFHIDPAVALDAGPRYGVRAVGNLQTPAWWVTGTGSATPARTTEGWAVTDR